MQLGWSGPANAIYFIYSFHCHQLPQRSFFLFGPKLMYSLGEIQTAWQNTSNPLVLRQFIGNPELGWKVAWSDRMVYMYASTLIFGLAWAALRRARVRQPRPHKISGDYRPHKISGDYRPHKISGDYRLRIPLRIPWWGVFLFLLPMAVDGTTHFLSDLAGLGQGFRYTNAWLAALTNNAFSPSFYVGNALGSFNSWMRLISGVSFGIGLVWFGFPYLAEVFGETASSTSAGVHREGKGPW
jgi:uncharacterized membrane protein